VLLQLWAKVVVEFLIAMASTVSVASPKYSRLEAEGEGVGQVNVNGDGNVIEYTRKLRQA